jgi:hypothetical protein
MVGHFRLNFNREIVHLDKPMLRKHVIFRAVWLIAEC